MSAIHDLAQNQQVWGTFENLREHLFDQFQNVPYDVKTGLPIDKLEGKIDDFLRSNSDSPRVLQKANIFRIIMKHGQIYIDPLDWFADKLNHGGLLAKVRNGWHRDIENDVIKDAASWSKRMFELGVMRGGLDMHHIAPGWEYIFSGGLSGLIEKTHLNRQRLEANATEDQMAFYRAVEIVYEAAINLAQRFSKLAYKMAKEHPEHEFRLHTIANAYERIPAYAPQTLHQTLQLIWFIQTMIEIEGESPMSLGHFDRMLFPYYQSDIESGRLTRDQAKELLKFFWIKYHARTRGKGDSARNFTFAGQCFDGSDATNELTYAALEARDELNAPDPKLSVRFFPGSPERLYRQVAKMLQNGCNTLVLFNDVPAVQALVKRGKTIEDARSYLSIGCYEPAVDGKEAACTMNMPINLAKVLELTLNDGMDPLSEEQIGPHTGDPRSFGDFHELLDAYMEQLDSIIVKSAESIKVHECQWPNINPSPFIAGTIQDCMEKGKDIGQGGPRYNSIGSIGVALANACDSLLALKKAVYEEKRFTMDEILVALSHDFEGYEYMRQYLLNRIPKWGNNHPEADALAKTIADQYCEGVHVLTNTRGGKFQAALFALRFQWLWGKVTGALPDGRKSGAPLAPGVGSAPGQDKNGVTGLIGSVTKLDFTQTPDGSVLDIMLHPSAIKGEKGLNAIVGLIKSFFTQDGYALQFNTVDIETLRDAQHNPEMYANLQIRVSGYSAYFTNLPKYEQDLFIARNTHTI